MKQFISFLLISILISSCGTSASFSKRKHLKGHFWKKSGMKGGTEKRSSSQSQEDYYADETESTECEPEQIHLVESESLKSINEFSEIEEPAGVLSIESDDIEEHDESSTVELEENEVRNSQSSSSKNTNPRSEINQIIGLFFVWILSGILGLFFLLLWFILAAFDVVGIWMLILGLSLLGVFVLSIIIFITILLLVWA